VAAYVEGDTPGLAREQLLFLVRLSLPAHHYVQQPPPARQLYDQSLPRKVPHAGVPR
jgi:hypothetical protein